MTVIEKFKSTTEEERRKNVTEILVKIENKKTFSANYQIL